MGFLLMLCCGSCRKKVPACLTWTLVKQAGLLIRIKVKRQSPAGRVHSFPRTTPTIFMDADPVDAETTFPVSYIRRRGWAVHQGALHGIKAGTGESVTTFELEGDRTELKVLKVLPDVTLVSGMEDRDPRQRIYYARVKAIGH